MTAIVVSVTKQTREAVDRLLALPRNEDAPEIILLEVSEKDNYPYPRMEWGAFTYYGMERVKEKYLKHIYKRQCK